MAFIFVAERSAEKPHSIIHEGTVGRRPGASYVSMQLRSQQLADLIKSNDTVLDQLASHFDSARCARKTAHMMRLDQHPDIKQLLDAAPQAKKHITFIEKVVAATVYSVDLTSKYLSYPVARAAAKQSKAAETKYAKKAQGRASQKASTYC